MRDREREQGALALEFGLLAPVLLILLLGMVWFGIAFNAHITLTQAAREGVRALALGTGNGEDQTRYAAVGLNEDDLTVNTAPCPTPADPDDVAIVEASYDMQLAIPFYTGSNQITLNARAVMRCGG